MSGRQLRSRNLLSVSDEEFYLANASSFADEAVRRRLQGHPAIAAYYFVSAASYYLDWLEISSQKPPEVRSELAEDFVEVTLQGERHLASGFEFE